MIKLLTSQDHSKKVIIRLVLICTLSGIVSTVYSQVKISGIVADSLSFKPIPNVHITVKNKNRGIVADENGFFRITANSFDTLVFSVVGYKKLTFPVLLNEEDIMILMIEDVTYLKTITVTGKPIPSPLIKEKKTIVYHQPHAENFFTGSGISFSYFSREQKEKRKLQNLITANEKVKAYMSVVCDPFFMDEILKKYSISKEKYYESIVEFNQSKIDLIAWKSEEEVIEILDNYFSHKMRTNR